MNGFNKWIIALSVVILPAAVSAQITERQRPAEWDNLIPGARFVDRFLPMPDGTLSSGVWGAANVVPRFVDNGIESPDISFWGGNILQDEKGTYHLFVCGWPENSPKGHMTWPQSTVYHAEGTKLHGPYHITDTIIGSTSVGSIPPYGAVTLSILSDGFGLDEKSPAVGLYSEGKEIGIVSFE